MINLFMIKPKNKHLPAAQCYHCTTPCQQGRRSLFFFTGPPKNSNPECNADFGFVADVSASVENHWDDEKSFIKKLVETIVISEEGGRAAVTSFSNEAALQIKFDDHTTYSTFEAALDQIPYVGSTTKIDMGLEVALDEMFQVFNGMRPDVHQTMVLITDGQQAGVNFDMYRERFNQAK